MSPEQLHALKVWIDTRTKFLIDRELGRLGGVPIYGAEEFEDKFNSIMLDKEPKEAPHGS